MRSQIVAALPKFSRGAFFTLVILIPFRFRFVLLSRPVGLIWKDYTDFLLFVNDIALMLTVLPWLFQLWLQKQKPRFGPSFITWPLVGLTLIAGLSSIASIDPALSIYNFLRMIALFGFFLYVINEVKDLSQLILPISLMVFVQALVAIPQALKQSSLGLQILGEYFLDPAWKGVSVVFTESGRLLRAYGLTDHPNILGGCLAFALVLLFTYVVSAKRKWNPLIWLVLAVGSIALFYTYSRSAWLATTVGIAVVIFLLFRSGEKMPIRTSLFLAAGLFVLLIPILWINREFVGIRLGAGGSFQEVPSEIGSIGERRVLISTGNQVFQEHALTGVGLGAAAEAFFNEFPEFPVAYQPVHFVILDVAVETGIFGAMFYLALLLVPWIALYLNRKMKFTAELIAASGVLMAVSTVGCFDYYTWLLQPGRLWQWLAWGFWAKAYASAAEAGKA